MEEDIFSLNKLEIRTNLISKTFN